jgi:16S rRNA (cytidine1402-2'-O)-methyltransferase
VVATPIGNLGDITLRAIETLRNADLVASEDTRKTGNLLRHFGIQKPQVSLHEHNEDRAAERVLRELRGGKTVALASEAGTPAISDPGFRLIRACIEEGLEVTMAPGPTALVPALVLSGLAVHSFTFRGFPPRKPGPRRRFLELDAAGPHTLIYYESPHRLKGLLKDALEVFGDRRAAIANDLTKAFERVWRGTLSELAAALPEPLKGEFVLVVGARQDPGQNVRATRLDGSS